jgi:hypothetical protein
MQCDEQYYEADTGFMCWITKEKCNKKNCTLKYRFIKNFSNKVAKELNHEGNNKPVNKCGRM